MSDRPARGRRPNVTDAAIALAVLGLGAGWRVGGAVARALRPAGMLCTDRWPCRWLAETGAGYRRAVTADAARRYRALVRAVATDAAREATASTLTETQQGVRAQAVRADRTVSRWVDTALRRDDH